MMVLDCPRVFTYEVVAERSDVFGCRAVVLPVAGFAVSDDVLIGVDADEEVAVGEDRFDLGDFHGNRMGRREP